MIALVVIEKYVARNLQLSHSSIAQHKTQLTFHARKSKRDPKL